MHTNTPNRIVFFDGICGLCNGWVDFLLRIDSKKALTFSPLQSEHAEHYVGTHANTLDSIIYYKDGQIHTGSSAVLCILKDIGGIWRLLTIFTVIPIPIRDWIYRKIAKNRYLLFGKRDTCRIPTLEEKNRFL